MMNRPCSSLLAIVIAGSDISVLRQMGGRLFPDLGRARSTSQSVEGRPVGVTQLGIRLRVLIPETVAAHRARLARAGFARSAVWLRYFNFVSIVAFR